VPDLTVLEMVADRQAAGPVLCASNEPADNLPSDMPHVTEAVTEREPVQRRSVRSEPEKKADSNVSEASLPPPPRPPVLVEVVEPGPRPQKRDFSHPDDFDRALEVYGQKIARKSVAETLNKKAIAEHDAAIQSHNQQAWNRRVNSWNERRSKALEDMPDYVSVAENPEITISAAMTHAILDLDNGPAVAYHLGKNPDEAKRIAGLSPERQFMEIAGIATRLERRPAARAATPAPRRSNDSRPQSDREPSMEEYAQQWQDKRAAEHRERFGVHPNRKGQPLGVIQR